MMSGVSYVDLNRPGGNDTSVTLVDYLSLGADAWLTRNTALNTELKYQFMNCGVCVANNGRRFMKQVRPH
jgi:hypothetical protein